MGIYKDDVMDMEIGMTCTETIIGAVGSSLKWTQILEAK
jgi:hypothetical protein